MLRGPCMGDTMNYSKILFVGIGLFFNVSVIQAQNTDSQFSKTALETQTQRREANQKLGFPNPGTCSKPVHNSDCQPCGAPHSLGRMQCCQKYRNSQIKALCDGACGPENSGVATGNTLCRRGTYSTYFFCISDKREDDLVTDYLNKNGLPEFPDDFLKGSSEKSGGTSIVK